MIRNQRHGQFMHESSVFLELHGVSSSGMALGKVLGFARDEKQKPTKSTSLQLSILRAVSYTHLTLPTKLEV